MPRLTVRGTLDLVARYVGKIVESDLEGGQLVLEAEDGTTYELEGVADAGRWTNQRVEVDGKVERDAMSFAMMGPRLVVKSVKAAGTP